MRVLVLLWNTYSKRICCHSCDRPDNQFVHVGVRVAGSLRLGVIAAKSKKRIEHRIGSIIENKILPIAKNFDAVEKLLVRFASKPSVQPISGLRWSAPNK